MTLACGHSGCLSCLKTLREPEHVDHRWCPMCKAEIPCVEFHVTVALKNLIYSLRVVCDEEGCHWLGKLEGAKNHFQECEFINVECKDDGCSRYAGWRSTSTRRCALTERNLAPCTRSQLWSASVRSTPHWSVLQQQGNVHSSVEKSLLGEFMSIKCFHSCKKLQNI